MKICIYPLSLQGLGNPQGDFGFFKGSSQVAKSSGKKSSWFLILRNKTVELSLPQTPGFYGDFSVALISCSIQKTPSWRRFVNGHVFGDCVCLVETFGKNGHFMSRKIQSHLVCGFNPLEKY